MQNQKITYSVQAEQSGLRLDQFLGQQKEIGSRTKALFLIDEKRVLVNKKNVKPSHLLKTEDEVEVQLPPPQPSGLVKYDFPLDIRFEDSDIIIVNKPAGLVVHPAHGHHGDTLVNALLHYTKDLSMRFGEERPGIVHRIDKETSGLLVIAKNDHAHENLSSQFKIKTTKRLYEAVVIGSPAKRLGHIESYVARHPTHRKKFASLKNEKVATESHGKLAITDYEVMRASAPFSLLELKLTTGRTHQIRIHLSELGYPIVGDDLYGADKKIKTKVSKEEKIEIDGLGRFLLHAKTLGFTHPSTKSWIEFHCDWPENDLSWMKKWKLK